MDKKIDIEKKIEKAKTAFKFKDLTVYKKAFSLAMEIFHVSKNFPENEKFGLTVR